MPASVTDPRRAYTTLGGPTQKQLVLPRQSTKAYLDTHLWLPKDKVQLDALRRALTFEISGRKVDVLVLYEETDTHILVPREFLRLDHLDLDFVDGRPKSYPKVTWTCRAQPDWDPATGKQSTKKFVQREALAAILAARGGVVQLYCGAGKTVLAIIAASKLAVPTLILVDNTFLLTQWREEIRLHTNLEPDDVGLIQGSTADWKKPVVLATYQTMAARAEVLPLEVIQWFGLVIWDELHHLSAETFSRSASLFPGYRLGLSATPVRDDGRHVIADGHLGPVIYKNLETDLKPLVVFLSTGFSCDLYHDRVGPHVLDSTGEVHYKKLSAYLGTRTEHQSVVLGQLQKATQAGRKVLVLSESIDELVNLFALYVGYKPGSLFTDVRLDPAAFDLQGQSTKTLTRHEIERLKSRLSGHAAKGRLATTPRAAKAHIYETVIPSIRAELLRHEKAVAYQRAMRKAQEAFIKSCLSRQLAGLIIARVKPELREAMIAKHQVTFAIMKYGKEGLNSKALDTVILTTPIAQKAMLQQVMGRTGREYEGKREPLVLVIEHDIGPLLGMCRKMRRHLTSWLPEDGGPYSFVRTSTQQAPSKGQPSHDLFRR